MQIRSTRHSVNINGGFFLNSTLKIGRRGGTNNKIISGLLTSPLSIYSPRKKSIINMTAE